MRERFSKVSYNVVNAVFVGAIALTVLNVFQRVASQFGFVHRPFTFSQSSWLGGHVITYAHIITLGAIGGVLVLVLAILFIGLRLKIEKRAAG